jgi:anaerobic ribonucleoside-triphosphate reductase activating protein
MRYLKDEIGFCEVPNVPTLNIYTVGCRRQCVGCHHAHLKDFNYPHAKILTNDTFLNKVKNGMPLIKGIAWLGGDPIYQPDRLLELIETLTSHGVKIFNCLYTGELFENVPEKLKSMLDVIKDGEWKGVPATDDNSNQRFFVKRNNKWNQIRYDRLTETITTTMRSGESSYG